MGRRGPNEGLPTSKRDGFMVILSVFSLVSSNLRELDLLEGPKVVGQKVDFPLRSAHNQHYKKNNGGR